MSYSQGQGSPREEEPFKTALERKALPSGATTSLEPCEHGQQELAEYTERHARLLTLIYRRQCPSGLTLSSYDADLLPEVERRAVEAHLRECPLCAAKVEETGRFLAARERVSRDGGDFTRPNTPQPKQSEQTESFMEVID